MDPDYMIVLGLLFCFIGAGALVEAFSHARPPRMAMLLFVLGGSGVVYAFAEKPGGYSFAEIPGVFATVIGAAVG